MDTLLVATIRPPTFASSSGYISSATRVQTGTGRAGLRLRSHELIR